MILLITLLAAAHAPEASKAPVERCEANEVTRADEAQPMRARRLDELPPARQEIAVEYREGGCVKPIIVRENVGGSGGAHR